MKRQEEFEDDLDDDMEQQQDELYPDDFGYGDIYDDFQQSPIEKHNDLFKKLTDFDKFIKHRVHVWLGLIWNSKAQRWEPDPTSKPIMNKNGAEWCAGFLENYARGNNLITNLPKQEHFNGIMWDIIKTAWINIGTRHTEFGITNQGDILRVCTEIEHDALLVLLGAANGGYNELFTKTTARHETVNLTPPIAYSQPMRHRKGFFERVKSVIGGG